MSTTQSFQRSSYFSNPSQKRACQRFLDCMKIGIIEWHDGIGYDLDALGGLIRSFC